MIDSAALRNAPSTLSTTVADCCGWLIRKNSTNATTARTMRFLTFTSTYSVPFPVRPTDIARLRAVVTASNT